MMRKFIKRIIQILDGTPAVYGKREKGQSVLEMAFITPLLIILIVGVVEIGWFANNYLILLEVTRVGARRGAVLAGENSPLAWDERATLNPRYSEVYDPRYDGAFPDNDPNYWSAQEWNTVQNMRIDARDCGALGSPGVYVGFYNLVLCQMTQSLLPIEINEDIPPDAPEEEYTDDIIISVFQIQMINNASGGDIEYAVDFPTARNAGEFEAGYIPVVVGRYPIEANECNFFEVLEGGGPGSFVARNNPLERNPFDYILDGDVSFISRRNADGIMVDIPVERAFQDEDGDWWPMDRNVFAHDPVLEVQRGFNYTGFRRVSAEPVTINAEFGQATVQLFCFGSDWTVYDVQELMKGRTFELTSEEITAMRSRPDMANFGRDEHGNEIDTRQYFASQGLVLVEIYWQHQLLLNLPVFSPVFNALGSDRTIIYVWSAFPVPAAVPNIQFE